MKICKICKKPIKYTDSDAYPIEEEFERYHFSCATRSAQIKKYREFIKKEL